MTSPIHDVNEEFARIMTTEENERPSILSLLKNGTWLDQQIFPELKWAVPGIIPEGFGLLTGAPKLGKSWITLGLALAVASGSRAFGHIPVGPVRPVLLLALEDGDRRLQSRSRELLGTDPIPGKLEYITSATSDQVLQLIDEWFEVNTGRDPLVILDTLGKVMPPALPGEGAYQRDYRVGSKLKSFTDKHPGSTLLVVHHVRKATGGDWMDSTSGTNGLNGSADFTIALSRERNTKRALIQVTGRDVEENAYALTAELGEWTLEGGTLEAAAQAATELIATTQDSDGLGDQSAEVVRIVAQHPEGIGPTAVSQLLGVAPNYAGQYLRRLADSGRIRRAGRGKYTSNNVPVETVETVETEPPEPPNSTLSTHSTPPLQQTSPVISVMETTCAACNERMIKTTPSQTVHPTCQEP